jgi:flagellar biosynthesis protein
MAGEEKNSGGKAAEFDKNRLAVALQYEKDRQDAPHVSAKGKGYMAEQIVAIARANGIEVREDRDLAKLLSLVDVDAPIPMEAYLAVAEILSYVYRKNSELKDKL